MSLPGLILRDADRCQALTTVWVQQVVLGLAAELELTPLQVLQAQEEFLSKLSFHTDWARQMFPKALIDEKIKEARDWLEILTD